MNEDTGQTPPADGADSGGDDAAFQAARAALLEILAEFAGKRWDTNIATQTLRRITDRRKEVIGQLWEAVEANDADATRLAGKFVEQFQNSMDARRRLDAVVRLMGRGDRLDPRTEKWFIDKIIEIAERAKAYHAAAGG